MFDFFKERDRDSLINVLSKTRGVFSEQVGNLFQKNNLNDATWEELEDILIASDIGLDTAVAITNEIKNRLRVKVSGKQIEPYVILGDIISEILTLEQPNWIIQDQDATIAVMVIGVNGTGKTTTIAKLSNWYLKNDKSVVIGAADTFRAAALDQIKIWGNRVGVDVVGNQEGSDSSAVAYDTISAANNRNIDVALIDTAGRLQSKANLMKELEKVYRTCSRIAKPKSLKVLLTIDATTGQNGLIQAKQFNETIPCDGIFLTKLDGTSKGGISIPIVKELGIPISFIGTGERLEDMALFDPKSFAKALLP